eukprot:g3989.t1
MDPSTSISSDDEEKAVDDLNLFNTTRQLFVPANSEQRTKRRKHFVEWQSCLRFSSTAQEQRRLSLDAIHLIHGKGGKLKSLKKKIDEHEHHAGVFQFSSYGGNKKSKILTGVYVWPKKGEREIFLYVKGNVNPECCTLLDNTIVIPIGFGISDRYEQRKLKRTESGVFENHVTEEVPPHSSCSFHNKISFRQYEYKNPVKKIIEVVDKGVDIKPPPLPNTRKERIRRKSKHIHAKRLSEMQTPPKISDWNVDTAENHDNEETKSAFHLHKMQTELDYRAQVLASIHARIPELGNNENPPLSENFLRIALESITSTLLLGGSKLTDSECREIETALFSEFRSQKTEFLRFDKFADIFLITCEKIVKSRNDGKSASKNRKSDMSFIEFLNLRKSARLAQCHLDPRTNVDKMLAVLNKRRDEAMKEALQYIEDEVEQTFDVESVEKKIKEYKTFLNARDEFRSENCHVALSEDLRAIAIEALERTQKRRQNKDETTGRMTRVHKSLLALKKISKHEEAMVVTLCELFKLDTRRLPQQHLQDFASACRAVDEDSSGRISFEEMSLALDDLDLPFFSEQHRERLFSCVTADADGKISIRKFLKTLQMVYKKHFHYRGHRKISSIKALSNKEKRELDEFEEDRKFSSCHYLKNTAIWKIRRSITDALEYNDHLMSKAGRHVVHVKELGRRNEKEINKQRTFREELSYAQAQEREASGHGKKNEWCIPLKTHKYYVSPK